VSSGEEVEGPDQGARSGKSRVWDCVGRVLSTFRSRRGLFSSALGDRIGVLAALAAVVVGLAAGWMPTEMEMQWPPA